LQTAFPGIQHSEKGPHGSCCTGSQAAFLSSVLQTGVTLTSHQPLMSLLKLLIKTLTECATGTDVVSVCPCWPPPPAVMETVETAMVRVGTQRHVGDAESLAS